MLEITINKKSGSVYPVVLCMVTALGVDLRKDNGLFSCEVSVAKSQHYLERMHLFQYLNLNSGMKVQEHQPQADLYL